MSILDADVQLNAVALADGWQSTPRQRTEAARICAMVASSGHRHRKLGEHARAAIGASHAALKLARDVVFWSVCLGKASDSKRETFARAEAMLRTVQP